MDQHPHGIPGTGSHRPARRFPGVPGPGGAPHRPPTTGGLDLLLRLTVLSLAVTALGSVVQAFTGPDALVGPGTTAWPGGAAAVVLLLFGIALTAALYAVVWFPLRDRRRWAWILGLVLCSLAVLDDTLDLAVALLVGEHLLPAAGSAVPVAVNIWWLVVAARPGVRAALR